MKATKIFLLAIGMGAAFAACNESKNDDPTGAWASAAPEKVTDSIEGATSATQTLAFDFNAPVGDAAGQLTYTADYDVTVPFVTDSATNKKSYQVTASIKGTWTQSTDDKDDYLLTFDKNTLSISGTDAPELGPVTDVFLNSLAKFTTIEDVEVTKDGSHMTFETEHPDVKYHFVRK